MYTSIYQRGDSVTWIYFISFTWLLTLQFVNKGINNKETFNLSNVIYFEILKTGTLTQKVFLWNDIKFWTNSATYDFNNNNKLIMNK